MTETRQHDAAEFLRTPNERRAFSTAPRLDPDPRVRPLIQKENAHIGVSLRKRRQRTKG